VPLESLRFGSARGLSGPTSSYLNDLRCTVAGALPAAAELNGPGAKTRVPMAISIMRRGSLHISHALCRALRLQPLVRFERPKFEESENRVVALNLSENLHPTSVFAWMLMAALIGFWSALVRSSRSEPTPRRKISVVSVSLSLNGAGS